MTGSAYYIRFPELVSVLGDEAAKKLASGLGGRRIYVPEHPAEDSRITAIVGLEASKALSAHIATGVGGLFVEMPTAGNSAFDGYRQRLRELAADRSRTEAQIAEELRVHVRTVRRMRAKLKEESKTSCKVAAVNQRKYQIAGHQSGV